MVMYGNGLMVMGRGNAEAVSGTVLVLGFPRTLGGWNQRHSDRPMLDTVEVGKQRYTESHVVVREQHVDEIG